MPNIFQTTDNIAQQLALTQQKIQAAAHNVGRPSNGITLLAVSKTQPAARIREAFLAGQYAFGENYCQEAREKQQDLDDLAIDWHFIGPIQSNKTRDIAEHFNWVHSIDRLKIAQRLSQQRPAHLPPLNVCLQINVDNEATKAGVTATEVHALAEQVNQLPHLHLRGLMAIPAPREHAIEQQQAFQQVATLQQHMMETNPSLQLDTLSMGMSADIDAAISAGSTIVRVGTAIFGRRQ